MPKRTPETVVFDWKKNRLSGHMLTEALLALWYLFHNGGVMDRLYLGTQGWSYPSWVGPFYPAGTPRQVSSRIMPASSPRSSSTPLSMPSQG